MGSVGEAGGTQPIALLIAWPPLLLLFGRCNACRQTPLQIRYSKSQRQMLRFHFQLLSVMRRGYTTSCPFTSHHIFRSAAPLDMNVIFGNGMCSTICSEGVYQKMTWAQQNTAALRSTAHKYRGPPRGGRPVRLSPKNKLSHRTAAPWNSPPTSF